MTALASKTQTAKGLQHFFIPFDFSLQRLDDEERIVEGYCYVNARVAGDRWNLKRSALEAATDGYMQMPCVREMHQALAAGFAEVVRWDDGKCWIRGKIVDDQAWAKVKAGVYRGWSVGCRPRIVRGNDIESCDWLETSLVDRPKDMDSVFTMVRGDGAEEEYDVEVQPEPETPPVAAESVVPEAVDVPAEPVAAEPAAEVPSEPEAATATPVEPLETPDPLVDRAATVSADTTVSTFADDVAAIAAQGKYTLLQAAWNCYLNRLMFDGGGPEVCRQSTDEFAAFLQAQIDTSGSDADALRGDIASTLQRMDAPEIDVSEFVARLDHETVVNRLADAENTLQRVEGELVTERAEVAKLRALPAQPHVMRSAAVPRQFQQPFADPHSIKRGELETRRNEVMQGRSTARTQAERNKLAEEVLRLTDEINRLSGA